MLFRSSRLVALLSLGARLASGFLASFAPEQVHLTFHPDPNMLVVSWVSFEPIPVASIAQFGFSPGTLNNSANGTFFSYPNDLCPTARGQYTRVSNDGALWSTVFNTTGVPQNKVSQTFSIFGDLAVNQGLNAAPALANDTRDGVHDFIIHYGDVAYNMDDECGAVGDDFFRTVQSYSTQTPVVYSNGNHETGPGPIFKYSEYIHRIADAQWPLARASGSDSNRWFSFSVGQVAFVVFDTDAWIYPSVYPLVKPQWLWMNATLASVDRNATPWLFVIGHRAMYCTKTLDGECNSEAETIRYGWLGKEWGIEQLLHRYGVDMYWAGHTHHYERTWPAYQGAETAQDYLNPQATVHVQSGIAGTGGSDPFNVTQKSWEAYRDTDFSSCYTRTIVHNATDLTVQQVSNVDRSILDQFSIHQSRHGAF